MKKASCTALIFVLAVTAVALQVHSAFADDDPPGRIARMNFTEGSVSFQPGGEGDWLTAVPNRPLTTGDNLWTDRDSRDELHVGSTIMRMGPETSLTLLDLDDDSTQLRLAEGSLIVRVRHLDDGNNYEIDTPNMSFALLRPGKYRVDVNPDGNSSTVTVWQGQGEVTGGGYSYQVLAGQRARFDGTDELNHDIVRIGNDDGFERWAFDRDDREDHYDARNYVSEEMTGYEDLDGYGRWDYVGGYGNVWVPNSIPTGWAPYQNGHWAWIDPWGWTWVDDAPWGFAPFHYGRWANGSRGWFWVPGPAAVRPVYAPALVAFIGGGAFTFGGGPAVGWFPLAPGEVYVPTYRVSDRYVTRVNITNTRVDTVRVTNVYHTYINEGGRNAPRIEYANQRVNNAVTVVPRDTFVNARPVGRTMVHGDARQLAEVQVIHQSPVQPVRTSVLGAATPARVHPPATVENRRVVAVHTPVPPRPSFEQRQGGGRPAAENVRQQPPAQAAKPAPVEKPEQVARPDRQPRPAEQPAPAQEARQPRAQENAPPQEAHSVPRPPEANHPAVAEPYRRAENHPAEPSRPEASRAQEPAPKPAPPAERNEALRPPQAEQNARQQQQWSHPLARPAPPVREPSLEQSRQEEQKFHSWQQQPKPAPAPVARAAPAPAPKPAARPAPHPPEDRKPEPK